MSRFIIFSMSVIIFSSLCLSSFVSEGGIVRRGLRPQEQEDQQEQDNLGNRVPQARMDPIRAILDFSFLANHF